MAKNEYPQVRLDKDLHQQVAKIAQAEQRSIKAIVTIAVRDLLARRQQKDHQLREVA